MSKVRDSGRRVKSGPGGCIEGGVVVLRGCLCLHAFPIGVLQAHGCDCGGIRERARGQEYMARGAAVGSARHAAPRRTKLPHDLQLAFAASCWLLLPCMLQIPSLRRDS
ncbi:MAG: hypothetical protein ACPIOQ_27305 [Promethearchaeia archaeon]